MSFKNLKDGDNNPPSFVHLVFVKINSNGVSNPRVESMKVIPKPDPIVEAKENLTDQIVNAKLYDEHFKTEDSWAALQTAITAAETAVNASDATEGSISEASENLAKALKGLTLQKGYKNLNAEMFNNTTNCNLLYNLFQTTGEVYGDGGVSDANWADLSDYDQLIITVKEGTPRLCMNRSGGGSQGATHAQ